MIRAFAYMARRAPGWRRVYLAVWAALVAAFFLGLSAIAGDAVSRLNGPEAHYESHELFREVGHGAESCGWIAVGALCAILSIRPRPLRRTFRIFWLTLPAAIATWYVGHWVHRQWWLSMGENPQGVEAWLCNELCDVRFYAIGGLLLLNVAQQLGEIIELGITACRSLARHRGRSAGAQRRVEDRQRDRDAIEERAPAEVGRR